MLTTPLAELTEADIVLYPVIGLWCEMCSRFLDKGEVRGRLLVDGAECLLCLEPITFRAVEFACPHRNQGACDDEAHHYGTGTHVTQLEEKTPWSTPPSLVDSPQISSTGGQ